MSHSTAVIESIDAETIYDVPLLMQSEKFDEVVLQKARHVLRGHPT